MGFFDRVLFVLFTVCAGILSLFFLLSVITGTNPLANYWDTYSPSQQKVILALAGLAFLVICVRLLYANMRSEKKAVQSIVHEGPVGQIFISSTALENLVFKISQQFKGVRDVKPKAICTPEGLFVLIRVKVSPDINIPQVSDELQCRVRDYLLDAAGVTVKDVRIVVDDISTEVRGRVE